jgi:hypothetical protein
MPFFFLYADRGYNMSKFKTRHCMGYAMRGCCLHYFFLCRNLLGQKSYNITINPNDPIRQMDRRNTLVLLPSFVMAIGKKFCFLNFIKVTEGENVSGTSQIFVM